MDRNGQTTGRIADALCVMAASGSGRKDAKTAKELSVPALCRIIRYNKEMAVKVARLKEEYRELYALDNEAFMRTLETALSGKAHGGDGKEAG